MTFKEIHEYPSFHHISQSTTVATHVLKPSPAMPEACRPPPKVVLTGLDSLTAVYTATCVYTFKFFSGVCCMHAADWGFLEHA